MKMQNAECRVQNSDRRNSRKAENGDLHARTKKFAMRIIHLYAAMPKTTEAQVIGKQLLRSGTSIGAQYCEAECARSLAEFTSKLGGARQESRETIYWLDLLATSGVMPQNRLAELFDESKQLFAMLTASINTAKRRKS
jgi:four helix bundle protein